MRPTLFKIGSLPVYAYSAMMVLALGVGLTAALLQARRQGLSPRSVLESSLLAVAVGLAGARLLYVVLNRDFYSIHPERIFLLRFTGLSFYGAFLGGALAVYLWSRLRRQNFGVIADLLTPYLILGYAITRIGCLLSGCCYGKVSGVYWAVVIPRVDHLYRHPVQLYASLGALLIFFILKAAHPRRPDDGFSLVLAGALYGLLRFITEFFREADSSPVWLGLSLAQLFSLFLILISTALMFHLVNRTRDQGAAPRRGKAAPG